jgi:hypothetical protein
MCYLGFQTDFLNHEVASKGKEYKHLNSENMVLHVDDKITILGVISHMYPNIRVNPTTAGSCGIAF